MLKAHELERKSESVAPNYKIVRDVALVLPFAAAARRTLIYGVYAFISRKIALFVPYYLRIGAQEHKLAPALEFHPVAGGKYAIILPSFRYAYHVKPS